MSETLQERLAAALHGSGVGCWYDWDCGTGDCGGASDSWHENQPADMLAADPHLAQDIEDGAALRRLREAWPGEWDVWMRPGEPVEVGLSDEGRWTRYTGVTIADACREAVSPVRDGRSDAQ